MKIKPESKEDIKLLIASEFNCFGGGKSSSWGNPIAEALKERSPVFTLGVDVGEVVNRVIELYEEAKKG